MEIILQSAGVHRMHTVAPEAAISTLGEKIIWAGRSLRGDLTFLDYGIPELSVLT